MGNNNSRFLPLYLGMFIRPDSTFDRVLDRKSTLRHGFFALLVPVIGYTLFYIMAWNAGGSPSTFSPWLALPVEEYFRYDIFLTLPGYYVAWVVASCTVFLISRLLGGAGSFENIMSVTGFGIGIATWSSMLHDLTDAVLSVLGIIDMHKYEQLLNEPTFWRYLLFTLYAIYFLWFMYLFTIGIRKVQRFGWFRSILLALVGLVSFQVILFIFIR
jgi:hypothetical protein